MQNKVGVILVNYHTVDDIVRIVNKYSAFSIISNIVIVNNDTLEKEKVQLDRIKSNKIHIIYEKQNIGYSKGNNIGIKYLNKIGIDYVIISNSDIDVDENTIINLVNDLSNNKKIGAIAPRMKNADGYLVPLRYIPLGYKRLFLQVFINNLDLKNEKKLLSDENGITIQSFLPGSFFICTMEALLKCEMFDPNVFLYREEEILAKRLNEVGYLVGVDTHFSYVHNHQYNKESLAKVIRGKNMEHKSERYYFKKYMNSNIIQMLYVFIFECLYTLRWSIRHIIKNRG